MATTIASHIHPLPNGRRVTVKKDRITKRQRDKGPRSPHRLTGVPLFSQCISYRRHRGTCGSIPLSEEYHSFHLISDEDRRNLRALLCFRIGCEPRNRHPSSR